MNIITSKDNTLYKEVRRLKEKKYRREKKQFFIEGLRFFEEAIKSNYSVDNVFIKESNKEKFVNVIEEYNLPQNSVSVLKDSLFDSLCSTENPQGISAVINIKPHEVDFREGFYVLVDKVQDPGNLGTIIRSAHASGALGVILTKGTVDVFNEKTLRSTMGSIFYVPIIEDEDMEFIFKLKEQGFKFIVSSLQTSKNYFEEKLKGKLVICVGNEGNGVSEVIYNLADIKLKIPMPGEAESLNVAVASSIMMFEVVRQNIK